MPEAPSERLAHNAAHTTPTPSSNAKHEHPRPTPRTSLPRAQDADASATSELTGASRVDAGANACLSLLENDLSRRVAAVAQALTARTPPLANVAPIVVVPQRGPREHERAPLLRNRRAPF